LRKLRQISACSLDKFIEAVKEKQLSRIMIGTIGFASATTRKNLPGFKALHEGVKRFKLTHNIVSRKITKFITKKL